MTPPPILADERIAEALQAQGFGERERSALRAFWQSSDAHALSARLRERVGALRVECLDCGSGDAAGGFFDTTLGVVGWELTEDWPIAMRSRWLVLRAKGAPASLPARVAAVVLDLLYQELAKGRASVSRLDVDLLQILSRLGLFVVGLLAEASSAAEARARWLSEHTDAASGLPNRAALDQLFNAREPAAGAHAMLAVLLQWTASAVMLNSAERDQARLALGAALAGCARSQDGLCRVGDDEWVLWAPGIGADMRVRLAAAALLESGARALRASGVASHATLCVGVAVSPEQGDTADAVFNAARRARAAALRDGLNLRIAGPELELERVDRARLEHEFVDALRNNVFSLHLQPIVHLADGACHGAEALLRWQRADGTMVPPPVVVELAEQFGQMDQLSRFVVQRASAILADLAAAGVQAGLSVNLAGSDLRDPELPQFVAQALMTWRVAPPLLTLELTEGSMIADDAQTIGVIRRLRDAGHGVALDDFGTGYSSLAWLRRLPATRLKIDRMFIRKMPETAQDHAIVRSVILLAQGLGLNVVAEGVEREEQLRQLRELGCDAAQGYLFARPMPVAEFVSWWHAWGREGREAYWRPSPDPA
ncbi:bifunctional diguanylate cyclase/phosphodiesterase [Niveibacterium sp. 24ML]|uniref:putative bifunctional diguanylate cyclase/phosphodiesterase n=1 Tax=Niveibacterium sp. 24ML TaxID=2985512 RepID=UPI0022705744|nr:bifunctional diguanylate cyclase/phosphodiesterase [Niveibacterium sp. 24ML]MCX9155289.1 bifunctional diguanylate cyclase/phosphodiesterase [Niveibacterium sp. 24ML]